MEIIVQTCDGITGFKERGPKPVRTEAYPAEMGFINAKTGAWQQQEQIGIFPTGNLPEPELGVIWKARNLSAYLCKRGLRTGQGQHDCVREMWESFLSSTHALCFACLFGALVVSVAAWWSTELPDTNIISSSIICSRLCLSWAGAVSGNQSDQRENLLIALGHTSCGKSTRQINLHWCNQLHEKGHYQDYQL